MNEPLMRRDAPDQQRDITTRSIQVRAATIDEQQRTVEAVVSTESPVEVYDWRSGNVIDEILLGSGAAIPDQMPLLANHSRWSLDDMLGSIRNLRLENGSIIGRLHFASDEDSERAWQKVRGGHITDVSVGYRVNASIEIQPGQTTNVNGMTYTAGKRTLRVATQWTPKEGSLVPIGADQAAKIREHSDLSTRKEHDMDPKLRKYLESIGLRAEANNLEAWEFLGKLQGDQLARAQQIVLNVEPVTTGTSEGAREGATDPPAGDDTGDRGDNTPDPEEAAQRAVAAERTRVREITQLAGSDVPAAIRQQAIDEGWDANRAAAVFLEAVRVARTEQPATPVPYHETARTGNVAGATVRSLAAGLLIGQGLDPAQSHCRMHTGRGMPTSRDELTPQDCEAGHAFRRMSAIDLVRECARQDSGRLYWDPDEAIRAASVSGGTLSYVFTTNVYARLLEGWTQMADTTVGWCDEEDVANFLTQEDISLQASARLEQLGRGGEAKHATVSDTHETYKIARYAKQFVVDEQDIIDDRLGAIMRMPMEMGQAARNLRPDLVYSLLLENPTLVADSGAVFNSTAVTTSGGHANLGTAALSSTALKAAITAMVKHRLNRTTANPGQQLTIRPRFLIVPAALEWTARELTAAAALAKLFADSSDPFYAQLNLLAQEGLRTVPDDRIGAIGVLDPRSGAARTGSDTNWFLTSGPGRGLRVAYRRGTGRSPQLRSFTLDKGQWGLGWDINMDIGAAFLDFRTWYKSTGAA